MAEDIMPMDYLPTEILEVIFCHVKVKDVSSLARASKRLNDILSSSEKVWNKLFQSRFVRMCQPSCRAELLLLYAQYGRSWRRLARYRVSAGRQLRAALDHMANHFHGVNGLPDPAMEEFRTLARAFGTLVSRDALLDEMFAPRHYRPNYLSRRYYAGMLYREIQRDLVVRPLMRRYMARPTGQHAASEAFHLMSLWMLPELSPGEPLDVEGFYTGLAGVVLEEVRRRWPLHPAAVWVGCRHNSLGPTLWTDDQALQLLDCVNRVLYGRLRVTYKDGPQDPTDAQTRNLLLAVHSQFLAVGSGLEGVLASVYVSVAGRLGVELHHTRLTDSWMVCWLRANDQQYLFIDVLHGGTQLSRAEALVKVKAACPVSHHDRLLEPIPKEKLLSRLVVAAYQQKTASPMAESDLVALRMLLFWSLADCDPRRLPLGPICLLLENRRPMYLRRLCQEYLATRLWWPVSEVRRLEGFIMYLKNEFLRMKRKLNREGMRTQNQTDIGPSSSSRSDGGSSNSSSGARKLHVGDVVQYRSRPGRRAVVYARCLRVCIGALEECVPSGRYHVLLDGADTALFVAQDELELAVEPRPIHHYELGRYFASFDGERYVPLDWLQRQHPVPPRERQQGAAPSDEPGQLGPADWLGCWPKVLPRDHVIGPEEEKGVLTDYEVLFEGLLINF